MDFRCSSRKQYVNIHKKKLFFNLQVNNTIVTDMIISPVLMNLFLRLGLNESDKDVKMTFF